MTYMYIEREINGSGEGVSVDQVHMHPNYRYGCNEVGELCL